jgi:hypothetical protein
LLPLGAMTCGVSAYGKYLDRAALVAAVPLTNDVGLEAALSHDVFGGPGSGRMQFAQDPTLLDPFQVWKRMRIEHYAKWSGVAYGLMALSLGLFVFALRRARSLWVAQSLAPLLVAVFTKMIAAGYAFVIVAAPVTRAKRSTELWFFCFAALTQLVSRQLPYNDDKYMALSVLTIVFGGALVWALTPWPISRPPPQPAALQTGSKKRKKRKRKRPTSEETAHP